MSDRYKGGILSPTAPTVIPQSAGGVYTLSQQLQYQGQGVWPPAVNYPITKSLRFRSSASAYLNRTPAGSPTSTQKFTQSYWVKRGTLSTTQYIYNCEPSDWVRAYIFSDNILYFDIRVSGTNYSVGTTQVFRDPSAWYHIVISVDTTQATAANRLIIYVNGVQAPTNTPTIPQNSATVANSANPNFIGAYKTPNQYFDGYLAEVNFIDGQALTPSSFGTTDAYGIWQPIRYSGTYGTNGFYLPFTNTTSTATLGNDFSGNGNTWTVNNISLTSGSTYDSMTDVPTNTNSNTANYCVLNTLDGTNMSYITVSNANLTYSEPASANGWRAIRGTIGVTSGKYRFSVYGTIGATTRMQLGLCTSATDLGGYNTSQNIGVQYNPYDAEVYVNGSATSYGSTQRITAVFDFIFDASTGQCWVAVNGTLLGGNPDAGTGQMTTFTTTSPVFPVTQAYGSSYDVNFGQRPWDYTIATASGFYPLNTYNLPTPTILDGDQYFNTTLYTGNSTTNIITNAGGMQPDFVWIKSRSNSQGNDLFDSIRGAGYVLFSNATNAETNNTANFTSFNSNGFSLASNGGDTNFSGYTYVAWQWRASNAAGVSNTQGTITSTVSANTTAGFSVATFTIQSSGNATVGHGLGIAPSMIIVKSRNAVFQWNVYHASLGNNAYLVLNATDAQVTGATTLWNSTSPTSTVFSLGTAWPFYLASATAVAYCFAQVAGYSAFGSYTGNGSTDGPFIYTGFRPRFVLIKNASAGSTNWFLYDSTRNTYNVVQNLLLPNASAAEYSGFPEFYLDFLSNGFKIRATDSQFNGSGNTMIYACFAENPFKIANAR